MPAREEAPCTLQRSPAGAQRTRNRVHDCAVEEDGGGVDETAAQGHLHDVANGLGPSGRPGRCEQVPSRVTRKENRSQPLRQALS